MKKLIAAGLAVASLAVTSSVASAQALCAVPLIISAAIVSATEHRELTEKEAWTCGLLHETPPAKPDKAKKKVAEATKPQ